MNFALFVLLNAILLIRPEELFPEFAGLRFYLIAIVLCTAASFPRLLELLSLESLRKRPVAVCVLLFFASTIVSLCLRGRIEEALFEFGPEFAKVVLYYFLLLACVDTRDRFRMFVTALVVFICLLTGIALANHYGAVDFPTLVPSIQDEIDPETGEKYQLRRLVSSGIFNDPNDLCLVLGLGILSCIYLATTSRLGLVGSLFWFLPVPLFVTALLETHSRGGLVGVLVGGAAYLYSRYGGPKALPFAIAGAFVILTLIGGRQSDIGGGGTAHQRVMIWAEGMTTLGRHLFLIPTGLGIGWFVDETGYVAHNSFVQAYVELGLFGGGAFLAMFYLSARLLDRMGRGVDAPAWVVYARHYGFAALIGYAMGCYSLTRNFIVPTFLVLGIASVLLDKAAATLPQKYRVDRRWFGWIILFSICGLVLMKFMTQGLGMAGI